MKYKKKNLKKLEMLPLQLTEIKIKKTTEQNEILKTKTEIKIHES